MPLFRVHGIARPVTAGPGVFGVLPAHTVTPKFEVFSQLARGEPATVQHAEDDDVVEVEFEDGLRLWTRAEDLERDFGLTPSRGAEGQAVDLPDRTADWRTQPRRGRVGHQGAARLRHRHRRQHHRLRRRQGGRTAGPGPGLYRCSTSGPARLLDPGTLDSREPTLVFLHGTASSTDGSFGGLWEGPDKGRIEDLLTDDKGQVLGFQHRTLTQSPIRERARTRHDAVWPARARRRVAPGLALAGRPVGRLLARGARAGGAAFDESDLRRFDEEGRERDCQALRDLNDVLARSGLRVTRFVRVACPARGTSR